MKNEDQIRKMVKERYAEVADRACCAPVKGSVFQSLCCGPSNTTDARSISKSIGYSDSQLDSVPEAANLGVGCGDPTSLAQLKEGEVVIDLGAGAGMDALLAAQKVGPEGRVIGVDMTPSMLKSARKNAVDAGVHSFVEFREGLIEEMPVASNSADVVISNCVINLSPDKEQALREAARVLKPGGRLAVSDIVLTAELPEAIRNSAPAYAACISGASLEADYVAAIEAAGFVDVHFTRTPAGAFFLDCAGVDPIVSEAISVVEAQLGKEGVSQLAEHVWSYRFTASLPGRDMSAPSRS